MIVSRIERVGNKICVKHNTQVNIKYMTIITQIINKIFCGECNNNNIIVVVVDNNNMTIYNEHGIDVTNLIYSHNNSCVFHYNE